MRGALSAPFLGLSLVALLAGCGGGGGGSSPAVVPTQVPVIPTVAPTQAPASVLQTQTLLGSAGFVSPTSNLTVYVLSADTINNSSCTAASGCLALWPIVLPPVGAVMGNGWAVIVRSDGKNQLTYNGNPLYSYAGDISAGQTNGNGINSFGGVWTIARPGMAAARSSSAPPDPTATPNANGGY